MITSRLVAYTGLDAGLYSIINVGTPVNPTDAANMAFATNASNISSGTLAVTFGGTGVATLTGLVKGNGASAMSAAVAGTDYSAGTNALATGIVKSTTGTGALSIAASGDIISTLGYTPVNKAGDTMSGYLILNADPVAAMGAATRQWVLSLVNGLIWSNPISVPDLLDDSLNTPPGSPGTAQTWIAGAAPTGAWSGFAGHVFTWNGAAWVDALGRAATTGDRFGINLEHGGTPAGGLTGKTQNIAQITGGSAGAWIYSFLAPVLNAAVFVNNPNSLDFGNSYTYTSSNLWVEFNGPSATPAGTGLSYTGASLGIANIGTAGTYGQVTTNAQGQVTSGTAVNTVPYGGTGVATLTGIVKGNGTSAFSAATAGTDYSAGTNALATGILKSTTTTGALSIAVAGTDYAPATGGSAILYGNGSGGFSSVSIGSGLAFSAGVLNLNTIAANSILANTTGISAVPSGTTTMPTGITYPGPLLTGTVQYGGNVITFPGTTATLATTANINTALPSTSALYKGTGSAGAAAAATVGTDYSVGTSALATGILKSTTSTGALSTAIAADFPTLNQSTTGNAATATNLAGGATGNIAYQSAAATTVFVTNAAGVLQAATSGAVPAWTTTPTLTGTNFSGTAGSLSIGGSAPAGSLTGTTLASGVTASSLTSVGSLTNLTMAGALNNAPTVTVSSASTVNIGAAAANDVSITGTTTITAFDNVAAGIVRTIHFTGILTLTYNATSLILPGAASITTAGGDSAEMVSLGSGNWSCNWYTKANGQAVVGAGGTSGSSILYGNGSGGFSNVTIGTNLTFSGGTLSASGSGAVAWSGLTAPTASNSSTASVDTTQTLLGHFDTSASTAQSLFALGEDVASTKGGTVSTRTRILQLSTLAGSTANLFSVSVQGIPSVFQLAYNGTLSYSGVSSAINGGVGSSVTLLGGAGDASHASGQVTLTGGSANGGGGGPITITGGSDSAGGGAGNVTVDTGTTVSGTTGTLALGSANAVSIAIGNGSATTTVTGTFKLGSNTISLAGNLTISGANALTLTTTGSTNVTLPTSGTLAILGRNTFTDAQNWAATVSLASAATVNIGAAASNDISITGTTTITAFDSIAAGATRVVHFTGILTLTHNSVGLILPSAANITTAAGDSAEMVSLGSGNWKCNWYAPASGAPLIAGAASTLTGTTLASNVVSSSLTSVGTITALLVGGSVKTPTTSASSTNSTNLVVGSGAVSGTSSVSGSLTLSTGASTLAGTGAIFINSGVPAASTSAGNVAIDSGQASTVAFGGQITLGRNYASSVAIGNTSAQLSLYGSSILIGGTNALSLAGNFTTSGAFAVTLTAAGTTSITLPTSGTLATTANINSALPSATSSQLYKGTGGVGAAAVASPGVDYGYANVPGNPQSANYTTVLADAGKCIEHPASDANARTFTIDSHTNVAWPDGTCITFENWTSQVISIAITTDTLVLAGTGTTGTRSLAQYGVATARYTLATNNWLITGTGLT